MDNLDNPVIAIIGAGAVGGYYGGRLAQAGHQVHFLFRQDYQAVLDRGLTINSHQGDFHLSPEKIGIHSHPSRMPKADLIIIALKATANNHLAQLVTPLVKEDSVILTLQNGLGNEQLLADLFGREKIMGGLAFVCINRLCPGEISHTAYGHVKIGEHQRPPGERAAKISRLLVNSGIDCRILQDLNTGRWEKLVWNVPFNGLGAALDLTTDRIINNPAGLELARAIMAEVIAGGRANGARLENELIENNIQATLAMKPYRSSMQIDRQTGRPMEIEAIFANPVRAAENAGVHVPLMRMLWRELELIGLSFLPK